MCQVALAPESEHEFYAGVELAKLVQRHDSCRGSESSVNSTAVSWSVRTRVREPFTVISGLKRGRLGTRRRRRDDHGREREQIPRLEDDAVPRAPLLVNLPDAREAAAERSHHAAWSSSIIARTSAISCRSSSLAASRAASAASDRSPERRSAASTSARRIACDCVIPDPIRAASAESASGSSRTEIARWTRPQRYHGLSYKDCTPTLRPSLAPVPVQASACTEGRAAAASVRHRPPGVASAAPAILRSHPMPYAPTNSARTGGNPDSSPSAAT